MGVFCIRYLRGDASTTIDLPVVIPCAVDGPSCNEKVGVDHVTFVVFVYRRLYATEENVSTSANRMRQSGTHCQQPPRLTMNR